MVANRNDLFCLRCVAASTWLYICTTRFSIRVYFIDLQRHTHARRVSTASCASPFS